MGWKQKYRKRNSSPVLKNHSIPQTFPGHEMTIVIIFKNHFKNIGFFFNLPMVSKEKSWGRSGNAASGERTQ